LNNVSVAKTLKSVGEVAKISENINASASLGIISGDFNAGDNGYSPSFAYDFASYRTGLTVTVGYGDGCYSLLLSKHNKVINSH
jgi:hypothetical protein